MKEIHNKKIMKNIIKIKYYCELCDFNYSSKSIYNQHLKHSMKHKLRKEMMIKEKI